jgi:hypothetical protein
VSIKLGGCRASAVLLPNLDRGPAIALFVAIAPVRPKQKTCLPAKAPQFGDFRPGAAVPAAAGARRRGGRGSERRHSAGELRRGRRRALLTTMAAVQHAAVPGGTAARRARHSDALNSRVEQGFQERRYTITKPGC